MRMENNTILITGGSSGIGLELARQFCSRNTVIITGRDRNKLAAVKTELDRVHVMQGDVCDPGDIAELYAKVEKDFPALNILINNAGIMKEIDVQNVDTDLAAVTQEIDTNLSGLVRMTVQFLPLLKRQKSAAIVNVSSALAFVPLPASPVYSATKAAVHSFTQSLRVQLAGTDVTVFELAPPATKTPLLSGALAIEGVTAMEASQLAQAAIAGVERGRVEIRPGQSNALRLLSRLAPNLTLDKLVKAAGKSLEK